MSRHELKPLNPEHKVVVGWDRPLETYFLQVYDKQKDDNDEDEAMLYWVGAARPRELYDLDALAPHVERYAVLTPEMSSTLYRDKDEGR